MTASHGEAEPMTGMVALLIVLFMFSFLIPGNITVASVTMGFPRLILAISLVPATLILLSNPKYKLTWVDTLVIGYAFWVFISVLINNGFARIQFAGLQVVETLGAYSLGRIMFLSIDAYRLFWRVFGYSMLFMLVIGMIELITERFVMHQFFAPFIDVFENSTLNYPKRMGFDRVQGNLEHPILFGVFWGFGMMHFLSVFDSRISQFFFMTCCILVVGISLSSGAYLALMMQLALLAWAVITKGRWKLLMILFALLYVVVEILSDRPAIIAITTRLAFSSDTAYWRVLIFEHGMNNVWANPIFGLGLRDWVRPHYLTSSIDNQWLLTAMRAGFPAFFLQMGAFGTMIYMLLKRQDLSPLVQKYRRNFLISFVGLFLALGTVAVWSGTQAFLWVLLAMGTSLALSPGVPSEADEEDPAEAPQALRGSRPGQHATAPAYARTHAAAAPAAPLPYRRSREALGLAPAPRARPRRQRSTNSPARDKS